MKAIESPMLDHIWNWLLVGLLSMLFNVTPIFAPPTWAMLAYFHIQHDIPLLPAAIIGATGATVGRVVLALASRRFGARLIPSSRQEDVQGAIARISEQKKLSIPLLGLFAVGPIPKSLLFMAAGMARMPLTLASLVYGFARAIMYAVALAATGQAASSLSEIITSPVGGPLVVVAHLATIVGMVLLFRLDLPRLLRSLRRLAHRVTPRQAQNVATLPIASVAPPKPTIGPAVLSDD